MIYLDNNSTTSVDPRVVERMLPYFAEQFGNASSTTHEMGRAARQAVEQSRAIVANALGASTEEVYFTSGATESNNLAIRGVASHRSTRKRGLVTTATEHRAVIDPVNRLDREGFDVEWLAIDDTGNINLDSFRQCVSEETALVSLMWGNNEIGTLHPLREVGAVCRETGVVFHSDAAQVLGKIKIDVLDTQVDLISISGHKVYGPKGVGAIYVRKGTRLKAIMDGGGHESGKRSGTLNVPGIVGFAAAVEIAMETQDEEAARVRDLMDLCDSRIRTEVGNAELNGPPIDSRLLGNLNYRLEGIDAETLTLNLPEVCISTGSACTSADPEPSHVLRAIGLNETEARSSIRIGVGRFNTADQIHSAVAQIAAAAKKLRNS